MSLHPPVLFIGDRPNPKKNLDMNVPFVGTKSYKVLLEWCYRMDIDVSRVEMYNANNVHGEAEFINPRYLDGKRIIVLGAAAYARMKELGISKVFKLPHPSGMNRELNDKKKLSELLARCRAFVYKKD